MACKNSRQVIITVYPTINSIIHNTVTTLILSYNYTNILILIPSHNVIITLVYSTITSVIWMTNIEYNIYIYVCVCVCVLGIGLWTPYWVNCLLESKDYQAELSKIYITSIKITRGNTIYILVVYILTYYVYIKVCCVYNNRHI